MITLRRIFGVLTLLALAACGGGGGGGEASSGPGGYEIPIAAGTGAAMAGATVTVLDSANNKTIDCSGTTDENGYITCNVPASYVPPFLITVYPADDSADNMKSVVISPTKGKNPRAPVTPLTNLLIEADSVFYETATVEQAKARIAARKKQISDALANVFTQILGADKAKNFDFLTDISFVPGSNDGTDLLLDNISVDTGTLKVSLKKNANANVSFTANTDPTKTTVVAIPVSSNDKVTFTTRKLTDFAGVYTITDGSLTLNSDGTIDSTVESTRVKGTYKLNETGYSIKISGTLSSTDSSGTFVGSVDNDFKLTIAYNIKGNGTNKDTDKGSVVSTNFTPNPTQTSGSNTNTNTIPTVKTLSDFAGTYTLNATWKSSDGESDSGTGTVVIASNGSVTSCTGGGVFVVCSGSVALKNDGTGATFSMTAKSDTDGTITATATGSVSNAFALSGSFNGTSKIEKETYTFLGTFTGSKNK